MRVLLLSLLVLAGTASAAEPAPLRIAAVTPAPAPCAALPENAPEGEKALHAHLSARLKRPVLRCAYANAADAARAVAKGEADFARVGAAAYAPVAAQLRPVLAARQPAALGRVLTVAAVLASDAASSLADLKGRKAVFGGSAAYAFAEPKRALADAGLDPAGFAATETAAGAPEAAAQLRSGAAGAMILHAAAWQRLCRADKPDEKPCGDLKIVWRGRPSIAEGFVMRRDADPELRLRLIGIMIALHLEARPALEFLASGAAELNPVEESAFGVPGNPS